MPLGRSMACLAGLGGGWCRVLGRERCHWQCESRLKALPPLPACAERESSFVVGDGSFTPSRGRYAIWGISKWRDAGRVLRTQD